MASSTRTPDFEQTQASKLTNPGLNFQSPFETPLKILYSKCPVFINPSPPNNIISATPQSSSVSFQPPYDSLLIAPAYYQPAPPLLLPNPLYNGNLDFHKPTGEDKSFVLPTTDTTPPVDNYDTFSPPTRTHKNKHQFYCDSCGRRLYNEDALIVHKRLLCRAQTVKAKDPPQTVTVPEAMFVPCYNERALIAHNRLLSWTRTVKTKDPRQTVTVPEAMFVGGKIRCHRCPLCGRRFAQPGAYSSHYKAKHGPNTPQMYC